MVSNARPVVVCVATTLAPATAAPLASITVPVSEPVLNWANARGALRSKN